MEIQNNQPPAQTAAPFSASLAMAFFAHHFLKIKTDYTTSAMIFSGYSGGTNVPCQTNVQVNTPELAENLLCISFWYLRENNCFRFAPGAGLNFTSAAALAVEINRSNQTRIPGLEFDLLEIARRSAPGATIGDIVKLFFQKDYYDPEFKVLERLMQWFVQLGYGQPVSSKSGFHFHNPCNFDFEFAPDCRRIASCEAAAQVIQQRWIEFQVGQPDVFRLLNDEVRSGVKKRTMSRRGTSNMDF